MTYNSQIRDRYESIAKRDFKTSLIRLLETEYKVLGSRRVLMMLAEDVEQLHQEYYPSSNRLQFGDVVWQTTKDDGQRQNYGKKTEDYAVQTVILPLIRREDIERRIYFKKGDRNSNYRHREARGFHADAGPFIFRYCYINNNLARDANNIPAGISGHRWSNSLVEYCYFKDNGNTNSIQPNGSHIVMYSDYKRDSIALYGFIYKGSGKHTHKNVWRFNLFEGHGYGLCLYTREPIEIYFCVRISTNQIS